MNKGAARKASRMKIVPGGSDARLFTLEVAIIDGPITEKFAKKNKVLSRTIQIRGNQTLEDLHHAIFDAFDREDEHMYEFQIGGKGPMDPKARRYVLPMAMEEPIPDPEKPAGDVTRTTIGSLGLKMDDPFGYWFDFGDDWWHQIDLVAIEDAAPGGKFPRVTKRVGESPPQYIDWDEEE
ncbi:MAG: plasmid pRiA4b ORF-3 family protein [Planctomycetes bacterium]|nr:plasmid pRiA4b ORF-3 family protein [Planctomycetota bacterium]